MSVEAKPKEKNPSGISPLNYLFVLLIGAYLGILFIKSEVTRWERVHDMFLFREAHMYLIISVAIVVAMISMLIIKRLEVKSIDGKPITYKPKPYHTGVSHRRYVVRSWLGHHRSLSRTNLRSDRVRRVDGTAHSSRSDARHVQLRGVETKATTLNAISRCRRSSGRLSATVRLANTKPTTFRSAALRNCGSDINTRTEVLRQLRLCRNDNAKTKIVSAKSNGRCVQRADTTSWNCRSRPGRHLRPLFGASVSRSLCLRQISLCAQGRVPGQLLACENLHIPKLAIRAR